jgi:hypothetical protein
VRTLQPQTAGGEWMGAKLKTIVYPEYAITFTLR